MAPHLHPDSVLQVLEMAGKVEWVRVGVGDGTAPTAPVIAWRYVDEPAWFGSRVVRAVDGYRGQVKWVVEKPGRNWVLVPERQKVEFEQGGWRTDSEYLVALAVQDPEFCDRAIGDLAPLLDHLTLEFELEG